MTVSRNIPIFLIANRLLTRISRGVLASSPVPKMEAILAVLVETAPGQKSHFNVISITGVVRIAVPGEKQRSA
jgi:hypothetical protein